MIDNNIYYTNTFTHIEKEGEILFIFPEIPTWLIANKKLIEIFNFFKDGQTIQNFLLSYEILETEELKKYERLFNSLISKKILSMEKYFASPIPRNPDNLITSFIFGITNKCNLRCSSCYNSYTEKLDNELSITEMKKIADEVLPFLSYGFSISGGEPFCRKSELFEILEYVSNKEEKHRVGLVTNGTLINEDDAKRLSRIGNLTVQISLDGITKESHEFNRGKNTFDKVIETIKILRKYDVKILLGVLLTEKSIHEIQEVLDFAINLGISSVRFIEMFWQGLSRSKSMKRPLSYELFPIYKNLLRHDNKYKSVLQKDATKVIFDSLISPIKKKCCGIDNQTVYIDSNGNVYPCNLLISEEHKLGNIREKNFEDIWLYSELKKTLCDLTVDGFEGCKSCEIRYFCGGGCRGTAYNSYGNIKSPPPNCREKKKTIYSYLWEFAEKDSLFELLRKV
jgi:radical SAM protein with 4Fe4S-binding SPASM domain